MAQIETWLNQDMLEAVKVKYLDGNVFSQDNAGNLIGVILKRGGEDYSGGGTVSANVIRADGVTVAVSGALYGNVATVVLPQSCYVVPGPISIVVKITASGAITTICAVVANVYQSSTDTVVDPGTIIPSIETLIAEIEAAVASIPADYSDLWQTLAPAYSNIATYKANQYVTYNGGLYQCVVDIQSGESWTSSHWRAVNVGSEIYNLKKTIEAISPIDHIRISQKINTWLSGITYLPIPDSGNVAISTVDIIHTDHDIELSCKTGYRYIVNYYSSDVLATSNYTGTSGWKTGSYTIPAGSYFLIMMTKTDASAMSGEDEKKYLYCRYYAMLDDFEKVIVDIESSNNIFRLRQSQQINLYINGITHLPEQDTGDATITTNRIIYADKTYKLNVESGYEYIVLYYSSDVWATGNYIDGSGWKTGEYIIPKDTYFAIQLRPQSGTFVDEETGKYKLSVEVFSKVIWHLLVTGQSLAVGAEGDPALTILTPFDYIGKCYEFNGGARPIDGQPNTALTEHVPLLDNTMFDFSSLCEQTHDIEIGSGEDPRHATRGETICSAMGYWFNQLTGEYCLVSDHAFGGMDYNDLKKGTLPYINSMRAVRHAKDICDRYGWAYKVFGVCIVHGEADQYEQVSADTYKGYLKQWQNDYDYDIKAVTGQKETVQFFVSQSAASGFYSENATVANGVFLASIEDSDIHLVCPQYCYPLTYASIHMNNYGYRYLGQFFGQIVGRAFNKYSSPSIYPVSSSLSNNVITIEFNHFGNLDIDTGNVAAVSDGHYGFELIDDTNNAAITSVSIVNDAIQIAIDKAPSSGAKISYAYKRLADEIDHIGSTNGVRGNLRSDWSFAGMFTNDAQSIPFWCCVFCVPVNWSAE